MSAVPKADEVAESGVFLAEHDAKTCNCANCSRARVRGKRRWGDMHPARRAHQKAMAGAFLDSPAAITATRPLPDWMRDPSLLPKNPPGGRP